MVTSKKRQFFKLKLVLSEIVLFFFLTLLFQLNSFAEEPKYIQTIELTQTPCTIVESEEKPRDFVTKNIEDCKRINKKTAGERKLKVLRLKPGKTLFRVSNKNVPYNLGFWVRGKGIERVRLPTVSGGGLETGKTKDYVIDLKPGNYLYSCPLNPTPDYTLIVEK